MIIALKNTGDLVDQSVDDFDLSIVEQCVTYSECDTYTPFFDQTWLGEG